MKQEKYILKTHHISKRFGGIHAVDELSFSLQEGTITSIIGPNGSGKSTLIHMLTGVYSLDGGKVEIDGVSFRSLKPYDVSLYGVTRTFQDVRVFEQMTVLDNILIVLTERGVVESFFERHNAYHLQKARDALALVGLEEKKNVLAAQLSYGQRKLLEIARALAMDTKIMLFDEPFAGLFPQMIKVITSVLKEMRKKGKTIVLIEHNMDLIRQLSDEILVLDEGKLLASGKPEHVLKKREVIEAYLGE